MEIDRSDVVPVGHQDGDVEVSHVGLLTDHQLLDLVDLQALQPVLGRLQVELLHRDLGVDGVQSLGQSLAAAPEVGLVTAQSIYGIAEHLPAIQTQDCGLDSNLWR